MFDDFLPPPPPPPQVMELEVRVAVRRELQQLKQASSCWRQTSESWRTQVLGNHVLKVDNAWDLLTKMRWGKMIVNKCVLVTQGALYDTFEGIALIQQVERAD